MDLKDISDYTVPYTVKHAFKEYAVTALTNGYSEFEYARKLSFSRYSAVKHICTMHLDRIEEISLPESLESIGYIVFSNNDCLEKIKLISKSSHFQVKDEIMLIQNNKLLLLARKIKTNNSILIPKEIEIILPYACANIRDIKISFATQSCLKCIDLFSFYHSKITSIVIPASCEIIEDYAFKDCAKLSDIKFQPGSKLKIIGDESFTHTAISQIQFPSNIEIIEESAFAKCSNLRLIKFDDCIKQKTICKYAFKKTKPEQIRLPECLESLEESVFQKCPIESF